MKRKQFIQSLLGITFSGLIIPLEPAFATTLAFAGNKQKVEKVKKQLLLMISERV